MSTHDSASRKHSRMWNSGHLSRSGYLEQGSQHGENDIQLSNHDSKHYNVKIVSRGGSSPNESMIGLYNDLEQDKDDWPATTGTAGRKGIMKMLKIRNCRTAGVICPLVFEICPPPKYRIV
jgi:hypothetical protein